MKPASITLVKVGTPSPINLYRLRRRYPFTHVQIPDTACKNPVHGVKVFCKPLMLLLPILSIRKISIVPIERNVFVIASRGILPFQRNAQLTFDFPCCLRKSPRKLWHCFHSYEGGSEFSFLPDCDTQASAGTPDSICHTPPRSAVSTRYFSFFFVKNFVEGRPIIPPQLLAFGKPPAV